MISDSTIVAYGPGLVITQEHIRQMRGNKSNGYITMDPRDFLDLTTSSIGERKEKMDEAKTVKQYNDWAHAGDNILPPWLDIETENMPIGKVVGHEGRHRAAALVKEKIFSMPVFLIKKEHRASIWRVSKDPSDPSKRFHFRLVDKTDFPPYALGQYLPYRVELDLRTWVQIKDAD